MCEIVFDVVGGPLTVGLRGTVHGQPYYHGLFSPPLQESGVWDPGGSGNGTLRHVTRGTNQRPEDRPDRQVGRRDFKDRGAAY